jgi:type VI secretion system protein ImpM
VSEPLTGTAGFSRWHDCAIGFYGKIPSRGDFVRSGLPRGFINPWDAWLRGGIAASWTVLGADWLDAWMEAAVWNFALSPGLCGPDAVLGLWMPSVDRVGRYFPLTLAAVVKEGELSDLVRESGGFLTAAERAGRDALEHDIGPDDLANRILAAASAEPANPGIDLSMCPIAGACWWTEGSPRVPRGAFANSAMPDERTFATMLDARVAAMEASGPEAGR